MKKLSTLLAVVLLAVAVPLQTGCSSPPSGRVTEYKTLLTVGIIGKTGMDSATLLLKQNKINLGAWQTVASFYDHRFQPAYNIALAVAKADVSSPAPQDLIDLMNEFVTMLSALKETRPYIPPSPDPLPTNPSVVLP